MEPAAERRDDSAGMMFCLRMLCLQWSPPLSGGTTTPWPALPTTAWILQWSPPLSGGTTAREKRAF